MCMYQIAFLFSILLPGIKPLLSHTIMCFKCIMCCSVFEAVEELTASKDVFKPHICLWGAFGCLYVSSDVVK
jgi:hypothetical protein